MASSIAGVLTMAVHPVFPGGALPDPPALARLALLDRVVHGFALAALPVMFLGALALTRRLARTDRLPWAALAVFGFAVVAVMMAGCMSGFVAADLIARLRVGDPGLDSQRMLLAYTLRLNQAFSSVYTVGSSLAIFLWSLSIVRGLQLPSGLGLYGLILAPVVLAALFAGHLVLNVHGFGAVVLGQAIWFMLAGFFLAGADDDPAAFETRANA